MTTSTTTDRVLDSIIGLCESLRVKLPAARAHLLAQLAICGEPAATGDAPKVSHTAELTPVEAAAHQATHLRTELRALDDELNAAALTLRNLHRDCNRVLGTRQPAPRCDGGVGRDGYLTPLDEGGWSHPDCWNIPDLDADTGRQHTTCATCRAAAEAWRRRQDQLAADAARKRHRRHRGDAA